MNRIDELKAKKEEYERLIKEEEERLASSERPPLFLEHRFADKDKPEYGPCWGKARPLVALDFLPLAWKVDIISPERIAEGARFFPCAACHPILKPALVAEAKAKGGHSNMNTNLVNIIARGNSRGYFKPGEWDGTCDLLAIHTDKKAIHLGRFKNEAKKLAAVYEARTHVENMIPEKGPALFQAFLHNLNHCIADWLGRLSKNYEDSEFNTLLNPNQWTGGPETLLKEVFPKNTFASQVQDLKAQIKELDSEIRQHLAKAIQKNIEECGEDALPAEIKAKLLDRLREKGWQAIDYDPFGFPRFPRR